MKIIRNLLILFAVIVLLITGVLGNYGMFTKIEVKEETIPAMTSLAATNLGAYQNAGTIISELYDTAKSLNIESNIAMGIYYDNPEKVAEESLRALAGLLINEKDIEKAELLPEKYQLLNIPPCDAKIVRFPYKGELSNIIAGMRVYPLLREACDSIIPVTIVIFDLPGREIRFIVPQNLPEEELLRWYNQKPPVSDDAEGKKVL